MAVRAKFQVTSVTTYTFGGEVKLEPRYDETIPEDQRFLKATPSGELRMRIDNPAALEQLKPGKTFYLDLTEVPPPAPT